MRGALLFIGIVATLSCRVTAISLEAERGTYTGHTVPRSRASGQRTVRLRQGQYVENSFTTRCSCSVTVTNVIYTNDGDSDTITLSLDGRVVGTFRTRSQSNYGNLWNVPQSSGRVGSSTVLRRGVHTVRTEATTTDRYLVEIDKVILALDCGGYSLCHSSSTTPPPLTTTTTAASTTTTAAPTTTTAAPTTNTIPTAISLEAERGTYTGHTVQRSRASGQRTVRLRRGQYVENSFTTHCSCSVTVTNVTYTNDGGSDTITLSLDGRVVGTFRTRSQSNYGNLWNVPQSSGRVGSSTVLRRGVHTVRTEATTTDRYLVEIDKVILALDCGGYSLCHSSSTTPPPLTTTTTTVPTTYTIQTTISLEAERGTYTGHKVQRSRASGQHTVRLHQGQYVENSFTTHCSCSVTVTNVIYTNDGGSDTITLSLDGRAVGTFHTHSQSNHGKLWNIPRHSGKVGGSVVFGRGVHTVRIEATKTDTYLVEIDRVILTEGCGSCHSTFTTEPNSSKPFKVSLEWLVILAMLTLMYVFVI